MDSFGGFNINGPYPGRLLFMGQTEENKPAFLYLVTGRSPGSRARVAMPVEGGVIMGPSGDESYNPLIHYPAVRFNHDTGLAVVSNGIQTNAIFETYKLMADLRRYPRDEYLDMLLKGAGAEPDSYHTPRIAGVESKNYFQGLLESHFSLLGITTRHDSRLIDGTSIPGAMKGVSTYDGSMLDPKPFSFASYPYLGTELKTPEELAAYLFGIADSKYNGNDVRVCTIGGVLLNDASDAERRWDIAVVQPHPSQKKAEKISRAGEMYMIKTLWAENLF